jgi:hypothetical protein
MAGRLPYPRHRSAIARLVKRDEGFLWPGITARDPAASATAEIVNAYAHRSDVPPDLWWHLLSSATAHIDFQAYALLHVPESHPGLIDLLREKSSAGCLIRIAVADPDCENVAERDQEEGLEGGLSARIRIALRYLDPLRNCPGAELRLHAVPMYNSVFRFDDDMFVTPHVYGRPGRLAPLLHLRRRREDGIFDNYLTHLEDVWATAVPLSAKIASR